MNSKLLNGLSKECPYVSREEIERFWQQAKGLAKSGPAYWQIVSRITKARAEKLDEKRRREDDIRWLEDRHRNTMGDWND